jgi:membrane protein YdbS with pleckstrin-like domain
MLILWEQRQKKTISCHLSFLIKLVLILLLQIYLRILNNRHLTWQWEVKEDFHLVTREAMDLIINRCLKFTLSLKSSNS